MDRSQVSRQNLTSSNCSTFSACETDLVKKYNLKPLSVNITRMSQKFIDTFKKIKVEEDVSESCDRQMINYLTNLQEIKLEPHSNDFILNRSRAEDDLKINTEAQNMTVSDESFLNLHRHDPLANENLQDEDQLQNEITSELIIKSEHEWSDVEETEDNASTGKGNYTNVSDSELCPDTHDVHQASTYVSSSSQDKDQLQNEFTSEIIIKSEHEWSDVEENQNDTSREDTTYIQDISGATGKKISMRNFQENRERNANIKFFSNGEFTTHSKKMLRCHMQVHAKSECEIGRQADEIMKERRKKVLVSLFSCTICGCVFKYKPYLLKHMKKHETNEIDDQGYFLCHVCNKSFKKSSTFLAHKKNHKKVLEKNCLKTYHVSSTSYECIHCNKVFMYERNLIRHLRLIHKSFIPCKICSESFISKRKLNNHVKLIHSNLRSIHVEIRSFKCKKCGKIFKRAVDLSRHSIVHSNARKYKCAECGNTFKTREALVVHIKRHFYVRSFECNKCEKKFIFNNELTHHMKIVHSNVKLFACELCGKSFKNKCHLSTHSVGVHSDIRSFQCEKCGLMFKCNGNLTNHITRIHNDIRNFACEKCGKMFKKEIDVKYHMIVHKVELNFECGQCNKKFRSKNHLSRHIKSHSSLRPFQCDQCDKKFKFKRHLSSHVLIHSNIRPFSCEICENSFKTKYQLKLHGFVHSNLYTVNCAHCVRQFKLKRHLARHIKNMHKNEHCI